MGCVRGKAGGALRLRSRAVSVSGPRTFPAAAWANSSPARMDFSALIALDVN